MSNSDIISAITTLIVAYQYKSGSVDWRLVGHELGVDKDCARMRVQRLLKKWPSTDLDAVEEKIIHSNMAKAFTPAKLLPTASPPQIAAPSPVAGIQKPRRNSLHYQDPPIHRRHSRANSLNTALSNAHPVAVAAFTAQPVIQHPAVYSDIQYDSADHQPFRSSLPRLPFPNQTLRPSEPLSGVRPDNTYLCSTAPSSRMHDSLATEHGLNDGMITLQRVAAAALADERQHGHYSSDSESSSSEVRDRAISPAAAEGAVMLEKMKIDTILV
ncbi:hypothetical protein V1512DRAFT_274313 [Lipomyces arxii]|uniref:uncharacterized protein n=1 Tax=Lipomyces arxii TaxID=56418 RepID=UPI0034CFD01B